MKDIVSTLKLLQGLQEKMDEVGRVLREGDQAAPPAADQAQNGQQAQGTAQAAGQQQGAGGVEIEQIVTAIETALQKSLEPITKKLDELSQSMGGQKKEGEQQTGQGEQSNSNDKQQAQSGGTENKDASNGGNSNAQPAPNSNGNSSGDNKQQESLFSEIYSKQKLR
jgi:hypothetical protein